MKYRYLAISALCALLIAGFGGARVAQAQERRLPVVATFSILGDIVENVGGDRVQVRTLAGRNGDMHIYEPTPSDVRALADAELYVEIGQGFEARLANLYRASGSRALRLTVTDGMSLLPTTPGDPHRHGSYDPHVWHDVTKAIHITYAVRDALVAADPPGRDTYYLNAAVYAAFLEELDAWIFGQVRRLPSERRKLVTEHTSLAYFADRYGFELLGTAIRSVSTAAAPSPRDLGRLLARIREHDVPAVFAENVSGSRLMEQLADDAGVALVRLHTDALGRPGSGADTYYSLMQSNTAAIVAALGR